MFPQIMAILSLGFRANQMTSDELLTRAGQAIRQRVDALRYKMGIPVSSGARRDASFAAGHFFFEPGEIASRVDLLRQTMPNEVEAIIERANRICEHRFDLLGYQSVEYGRTIDWNLDAVHGRRAPQKPWFKIRFLNFEEVGDAKIIWELNRHQHLVLLARAYLFTKDERYVSEALTEWNHWRIQNPYPIGINWASSLEVAFRSLSWLWMKHLLSTSPIVSDSFWADLEDGLALHARHIRRFLSTYFSPNTHLLGEAVALFFLGTLCHRHAEANEWAASGWNIITQEAERQVREDGMHFEQSTYYHVYALDFLLHARILAARNGLEIPVALDAVVEKMLSGLSALGHGGVPPLFGDDDGGRVFDRRRNKAENLLDPLAVGALLFARSDFAEQISNLTEEAIWLLGPDAAKSFQRLSRIGRRDPLSHLPASGIYIMASSVSASQKMVVDAGPLGTGRGGHGHADALSIHFTADDREWLIDPGTFEYVGAENQRNQFRSTAAHNTLEIDGLSQADPDGTFAWRSLPEVGVETWARGRSFHFFSGKHDGYSRLSQPIVHRRWIFQSEPSQWLIRDRAEGVGIHNFAINWHFAPGHQLTAGDGRITAKNDQGQQVIMLLSDDNWHSEIAQGWASPVYGIKQPAEILRLTQQAAAPVESGVVLLYQSSCSPGAGILERLNQGSDGVQMYRFRQDGSDRHIVFGTRGQAWQLNEYSSDAELLYIAVDNTSERDALVLVGGSYLQICGRTVLSLANSSGNFEFYRTNGKEEFRSQPQAQLSMEQLYTWFEQMRAATDLELALH